MNLLPKHDNLFVERDKQADKYSPGGILLPEIAQKAPDTAVVIAVGPGRMMENGLMTIPDVQVGDRVLIGRFAGIEINWGLEKRTVIPWDDVLGIVEGYEEPVPEEPGDENQLPLPTNVEKVPEPKVEKDPSEK